jgi:hypothetical protein
LTAKKGTAEGKLPQKQSIKREYLVPKALLTVDPRNLRHAMGGLETLKVPLIESLGYLEVVDVKFLHLAPGHNILLAS